VRIVERRLDRPRCTRLLHASERLDAGATDVGRGVSKTASHIFDSPAGQLAQCRDGGGAAERLCGQRDQRKRGVGSE
jgi:hypothetical protein